MVEWQLFKEGGQLPLAVTGQQLVDCGKVFLCGATAPVLVDI